MTAPERALCLQCGRSGAIVWESMDPDHPFIECAWRDSGGDHGHGVTLETRDQIESDGIQVQKRERRLAANHARGAHDVRPDHKCPLCELERPHRGHLRARYSDPTCERCQAAAARASDRHPGDPAPPVQVEAFAQSRRSE